ncbi:dapper homolog 1 [Trematomus bernacchii]|uniref:dapper homolog 1 n=1 Tax=Trematomus bernacchii TaxID=40690 RepID=UPI00146CA938|nr:dapper homolog 1 [Trematomus bernacchii]
MPLSVPSRRDTDGRCSRDRTAVDADMVDAAERQRAVRERQEAAASGLQELEFLRQRQERLVRGALELREEEVEEEEEEEKETQLNSEEKILEENILLLRKQLNCLRRRDAGLITQLQELDRQISDLRLDTEASHDQLENDSRPSSGFYELSDGASGSLSNSSNSVFSECFCSMAEADGRLISADERASCLECDGLVGGLRDDSSFSGTVRRSLSAPHPVTLDPLSSVASCDSQSKYHCDLVAKNGSEVYRYPSPLHAVAVQSPVFIQMLGPIRDDGSVRSVEAGVEGLKLEPSPLSASVSAPLVSQSSSWPATFSSQTPSLKRLDSYIFSLLQRRALPVRTSRPRTSISTDPSKSILRQASLCVRQVSGFGFGTLRGSEFRPSLPAGGASAESWSPQRQWSVESKPEEETQNVFPEVSVETMQNGFKMNSDLAENQNSSTHSICIQNGSSVTHIDTSTNSLLKQKSKGLLPPSAVSTLPKDFRELGIPKANSSPKETQQPCYFPDQDLLPKSPAVIKTSSATPKNSPKPLQNVQTEKVERSEVACLVPSSHSQDEAEEEAGGGHNAKYFSSQGQNVKHRKSSSKNVKSVKVKTTTTTMKTSRTSEHNEHKSERRGDKSHHRSKKYRLLEDGASINIKVSKRAPGGSHGMNSSRIKRLPASIPEGRVLDKHDTSTLGSVRSGASRHHGHHHHHHQGRDQVAVVAKPKHKRNDYRRLRAIMELQYDEAFRRAQRRQRKELLNQSAANVYLPSAGQVSSPYSYVARSDSEYSAECASLFHSTIVDTSEDERSNYTTNRFGDSESSEEEYIEESTTTSDTEESGGGGAGGMGRGRNQLGATGARVAGQEMTPAQAKAFVKIKASRNLKKKILRFRSGSLKLMTTV